MLDTERETLHVFCIGEGSLAQMKTQRSHEEPIYLVDGLEMRGAQSKMNIGQV